MKIGRLHHPYHNYVRWLVAIGCYRLLAVARDTKATLCPALSPPSKGLAKPPSRLLKVQIEVACLLLFLGSWETRCSLLQVKEHDVTATHSSHCLCFDQHIVNTPKI